MTLYELLIEEAKKQQAKNEEQAKREGFNNVYEWQAYHHPIKEHDDEEEYCDGYDYYEPMISFF